MRSNYHMKTQLLLFQKVQKFVASVSPVAPRGDDKESGSGLWQELALSMKSWTLFPPGESFRWQQLQTCWQVRHCESNPSSPVWKGMFRAFWKHVLLFTIYFPSFLSFCFILIHCSYLRLIKAAFAPLGTLLFPWVRKEEIPCSNLMKFLDCCSESVSCPADSGSLELECAQQCCLKPQQTCHALFQLFTPSACAFWTTNHYSVA